MASQSQGVQQLLAAEKKAAEKVAEARKRKARRLKQAKDEAQQEIEKFRLEREQQYKQYEAKHLGSQDDVAARIKKETVVKKDLQNQMVANSKDQVIARVLAMVQDIKPELHQNVRLADSA
ncbi:Vacuolar (H+)-ATPase G subunit [Trinorchestia longiramus]|nr:Vacuolar (H+)-ATPase G subunit [Trinorchestia longiramus]